MTQATISSREAPKTVLVTGGAGFLGINLIRFLLARGHRLRSYDIAPFPYPEAGRIDVLQGDIRHRALHDRAFDGVDVVVHCAAALPLADPAEIHSTNVDGTFALLESAARKGIERFVHISSTAVYGIPDHHPLIEADPMQGVGPYGASKVAAEGVCKSFRVSDLVLPILRPKSFVGPERLGAFELLYDFASTGHNFPVLGSGNNRYQLLDVDDLNEAICLTAFGPAERVNDTFNIGAGEFGSLRDSFQAAAPFAALQVDLRNRRDRQFRQHRPRARRAWLRAALLQHRRAPAQFRLVPGKPRADFARCGRHPPGAVEAGCAVCPARGALTPRSG